jgi:signal transduction histidine kinase
MGTGSTVGYHRWQRLTRAHPVAVDAIGALALVGVSFSGTVLSAPGAPAPSWSSGIGLICVACAALLWRRQYPRITTGVTIACVLALAALGYVLTPLLLAPAMAALFSLAFLTGGRPAWALTVTAVAGVVCTASLAGPVAESLGLKVFGPQAWLLLPTLLGVAARGRSDYQNRAREEEARHRVAEERMRIARELHDVAAHHLALANAQAGTVAHLIPTDPGRAARMATELSDTISSALRELKGTVGLLREDADPRAPLEPVPGLAQLPALADSLGAAGLTVITTTTGTPRPLPPAVDLTVFRLIQEALTNVAKHAAVPQAHVRLAYTESMINITVSNDAGRGTPASPPGAPGYGLAGMRERAASVGGHLQAGPRAAGGFEVTAGLPLRPRPREEPEPRQEELAR